MRRQLVGNHIHRFRNPLVNQWYLWVGPIFMVMNQDKSELIFNLIFKHGCEHFGFGLSILFQENVKKT